MSDSVKSRKTGGTIMAGTGTVTRGGGGRDTTAKQMKYFVSSLNTSVGHALVEALRNDHINDENPHLIVGSLSPMEQSEVPRGVYKVIDATKLMILSRVLLDADIIVYDLNTCDLEEAEFAVKTLKLGEFFNDKLLIFISSVMVWSNTPARERVNLLSSADVRSPSPNLHEQKEGEEIAEEDGIEDAPSDNEGGNDNNAAEEDSSRKRGHLKYTEKEFLYRKPLPKYETMKALEAQCIAAGRMKDKLKSFVVCSGIQYGNGEDVFYEHFKDGGELSVIGDGKNRIPTIHVRDLVKFVEKIIEKPPKDCYIIAVDHSAKPTQLSIVQAISSGVGNGKIKHIDVAAAAFDIELFDVLTLDLRLRPSRIFEGGVHSLAQQDAEYEDEANDEDLTAQIAVIASTAGKMRVKLFDWHAKEGLVANIAKVNREFNDFRGLKPNRIYLTGPPAAGKTFIGKKLASQYNIPHIDVKSVVEGYLKIDGVEGDKIRGEYETLKAETIEKARIEFDAEMKKKKPKKGEVLPVFEENTIVPRLSDEKLFTAFKWRLSQVDCVNRGYVLDGFPRTALQARAVFLSKPSNGGFRVESKRALKFPESRNEEVGVEEDSDLLPDSVIILEGGDEFLKQRVRALPEEENVNSHYTEEGMVRRLAEFRKNTEAAAVAAAATGEGGATFTEFFKGNQVETITINIESGDDNMLTNILAFLERNGGFSSPKQDDEEEDAPPKAVMDEEGEKLRAKQAVEEQAKRTKEDELRKLQEEDSRVKAEKLKNTEREKLDERSQGLRQYLADNLLPYLTEGLIEICKSHADDPVQSLTDYLLKRSQEVHFPDAIHPVQ